jgi:hypothetical protein
VKLGDLPGLVRLRELLLGQATDRVEVSEVRLVLVAAFSTASRYVPDERREDFLRELEQATGGIVSLGEIGELSENGGAEGEPGEVE